jgi:acetyltransferase-like isoleucine patch superfamily enzyme
MTVCRDTYGDRRRRLWDDRPMTKGQIRMAPRLAVLRCLCKLYGIEAVNRDLATRTQHVSDVLTAFGAKVTGPGVLHGPLTIHNADGSYENLHIGRNVHLGRGVFLDLTAPLEIGADATVAMGCTLLTHSDVGNRPLASELPRYVAATTVGEGAYLAANVTVLAGCHIGRRAVVAAGGVVTRPVRDGSRVAGVPAREIPPGGQAAEHDPHALGDYQA